MCTKCRIKTYFYTLVTLAAGGAVCVATIAAVGKALGIVDVAKKVEEKVEEK